MLTQFSSVLVLTILNNLKIYLPSIYKNTAFMHNYYNYKYYINVSIDNVSS